jgi:hypothetical protein
VGFMDVVVVWVDVVVCLTDVVVERIEDFVVVE